MEDYIELMVLLGFPRWHVEGEFMNHINGAMLNCKMYVYGCLPKAHQYMKDNKLNPLDYNYTECWLLADDFVRSNVPPQFEDDDGENWYEETFDMWQAVFAYIAEQWYMRLYLSDEEALLKLTEDREMI